MEVDTFSFWIPEVATYLPGIDVDYYCSLYPDNIGCTDQDVGQYELFLSAFESGGPVSSAAGDVLVSGDGKDTLVGTSGNDAFFVDEDIFANDEDFDTIEDPSGTATLGGNGRLAAYEGETIRFNVRAVGQGVTYQLSEAPAGAILDPATGQFTWTPPDNGRYFVQVTATGDSGITTQQIAITVHDVAPRVFVSGSTSVSEGVDYVLKLGSVTEPGMDSLTAYWIDWGDGTPVERFTVADDGVPTGKLFQHPYADGPHEYMIQVSLEDEEGTYPAAATRSVLVKNAPPQLDSDDFEVTVGEGSTAVTAGKLVELGPDAVWLEASCGTVVDLGNGRWNWSYTPLASLDKHQLVTITATDSDGGVGTTAFALAVDNVAPNIASAGDVFVNEGATATNSGTWSDPGGDPVTLLASIGSVTKDDQGTWSWSFHTSDGPDESQQVTITAIDSDGAVKTATFTLTVVNRAPTIPIAGVASVQEGTPYTLSLGSVADPGTDTVTQYIVDWGDGTSEAFDSAGAKTHTYLDDAENVTIRVALVDEDGTHENAGTLDVMVENVAPTMAISGAASVDEGELYTLTLGSIHDPGNDSVTEVWVNWGDGQVTLAGSASLVTHVFDDGASDVLIQVDLVDEDGTHVGVGILPLTVHNVAPSADFEAPSAVDEGDVFAARPHIPHRSFRRRHRGRISVRL